MIDEYDSPDEGRHFYSCGLCVKDGAALGSIVHWCSDLFGLIGGDEQTLHNGDGRDVHTEGKNMDPYIEEIEAYIKK